MRATSTQSGVSVPKEASASDKQKDGVSGQALASRLKRMLKAGIPKTARKRIRFAIGYPAMSLRLWSNYNYDRSRFLRWSSVAGLAGEKQQLCSWIDADAHKIEKALALKSPRPGFGKAVVHRLMENLHDYVERFGPDRSTHVSLNVLRAYVDFGSQHGISHDELAQAISKLSASGGAPPCGGVSRISREEILAHSKLDLEQFFFSRHSIRHFSDEEVDYSLIERAVYLASKTPTVCNRQSLRVYAYPDPEDRKRVLACQMGNSGFGDQIKVALVVTADSRTFFSVGERNQGWIDGGLFSMSLIYALHSLGLGSCCLNWSVEKENDKALRTVTGIPEAEMVIMMIGVGALPESLLVAQSPRRPVSELLVKGRTQALNR